MLEIKYRLIEPLYECGGGTYNHANSYIALTPNTIFDEYYWTLQL